MKGSYPERLFLLIGNPYLHKKLLRTLQADPSCSYKSIGFIDVKFTNDPYFIGHIDKLPELIQKSQLEEIFVAMHLLSSDKSDELVKNLNAAASKIKLIPDMEQLTHQSVELSKLGDQYILTLHEGPLSYWYSKLLKRLLDVCISLLVILFLLSWLMPLLSFIYWIAEGGGPLFRQKRTSLYGRIFTILKFRTMRENESADKIQATFGDERITKLGRILRQCQLDELPQFWNVLVGEMSIIGPRPHMLLHTKEYSKVAEQFMLRHSVKPGISGLAQINGFRGEVHSDEDIAKRVYYDLEYINNWSFSLDLFIMWKTLLLILGFNKKMNNSEFR
jgi:exopolysaccharide biosynthesis polyprenyl glycosylphosphotransferase